MRGEYRKIIPDPLFCFEHKKAIAEAMAFLCHMLTFRALDLPQSFLKCPMEERFKFYGLNVF